MKKIILILSIIFNAYLIEAQTNFDKFEKDEKVNSVIVNKKMFDLIGKVKVDAVDTETQNYLTLIKKLDYLRVFSSKDVKSSASLLATADAYLKQNPLDELMRSLENGKSVKIFVKTTGTDDVLSELLMLIEDQGQEKQVTVMSLLGKFTLNELTILTDKMKLPGSEAIKNAAKK
nr:DUF4252 domain-containing protein [uncultured Flavobacterium sp.]